MDNRFYLEINVSVTPQDGNGSTRHFEAPVTDHYVRADVPEAEIKAFLYRFRDVLIKMDTFLLDPVNYPPPDSNVE